MTARRLLRAGCAGLLTLALLVPPQVAAGDVRDEPATRVPTPGLASPVTIDVDEWGVPHIFAENSSDMFFAQGWQVARDRLFQIDLWRRRGLGELSEVFGERYVDQDRATRQFLYQGDMDKEWAAYAPGAKDMATRFTSGINAYIDWLKDNPAALPPEFTRLDYLPDKWAPEDVVRNRTHGLTRNVSSELALARGLACKGRLDLDPLRHRNQPEHTTGLPEGLDYCDIPANALQEYERAVAPVSFTGNAAKPLDVGIPATDVGSNNWAVSADRTSTGRAILANDPHRAHENPSLRYITHLSSPELDIIGAGEPALPGVSIGHNGTIGFGLTVFAVDESDLYVYDLDKANQRYRYKGRWERLRTVKTEIGVRGGKPVTRELLFTRHGPVSLLDAEAHRAYAVRTIWSEPGTAPYFGSSGYMGAKNWDEFKRAMAGWGTPGENQVYADVDGNVGWIPGGRAPKRSGYDGLLPVPGDGRYEWAGFQEAGAFPNEFNPDRGFVSSANQFNAQDDSSFGYEWSHPIRKNRIDEVLAGDDQHSVQDSRDLQSDVLNIRAREIVGLVRGLDSDDELTKEALEFVRGYDAKENLGSPGAALYRGYWESGINAAVKRELVAPEDLDAFGDLDWLVVEDALRDPDRWFAGGAATRDALLLSSLRAAYAKAKDELGADPARWGYKGVTRRWDHRLGAMEPAWNLGPVQMPGSAGNPLASANASFKMVLDVGSWDDSVALNVPGQSGVPGSPHYSDLIERWRTFDYFPLLYGREAIERHTEQSTVLTPG